jgi:hypothetical protein
MVLVGFPSRADAGLFEECFGRLLGDPARWIYWDEHAWGCVVELRFPPADLPAVYARAAVASGLIDAPS